MKREEILVIKIVFEDNKDTPSSTLLKCLPIGADIEFSDGNSYVISCL